MTFDWSNPYPTTRAPLFARNVVSTSHPLAAQAGLRMLMDGGSAVDAAIAAAAMLTVVEPVSCGLGGDAFAIVWDGATLHGLNASGAAPAVSTLARMRATYGADGAGHARIPERGWDAVTTPGVVSGWVALHERFGKLPFADVLEPAAVVAERGVSIAPIVARKWAAAIPIARDAPGFAHAFMPCGRAPRTGEKFVFKNAARGVAIDRAKQRPIVLSGRNRRADRGVRARDGRPADARGFARPQGALGRSLAHRLSRP